jgi:acylphosphatase
MLRVGEKVVVLKPLSNTFGMTGYVRMIEDGYVYVDYDEDSIKAIKKHSKKNKISPFATLTGEAFSPRHVRSLISFIREQKLILLGI